MAKKKNGMERVIASLERIAFDEDGVKTSDRLRALEQYAKYTAESETGEKREVTVYYDYGSDR